MSEETPTRRATDSDHLVALPAGTRLGKYRLDQVLGHGGFGITYRAFDTALDRAVAIKEYLPSDVAVRIDGTTVQAKSRSDADTFEWGLTRFLDEAKALAKFENVPAVVRVYDYLQANGTAYMVMALVEGEPLNAIYARERTLEQARLMAILMPMLDGLDAVHRANVLHRDIKPSNIVLRPDGAPVLLDFGAARSALGDKSRSMTAVFTPGYAPFEQYMSAGKQGPWTDIYALAATIYHGVTGKVPPPAAERVYEDPMPPAIEAGAGRYDPWFLTAIDRGLAVQEKMRPQSVSEWRPLFSAAAPAGAAPTQVVRARPPADAPATAGHAGAGPRGAERPASGSKRFASRRALLFGGGLGGLAAAAAVALTLSSGTMSVVQAPATDKPREVLIANRPESPDERARRLTEEAQKATEEARRAQLTAESEAMRQAEQEARRQAEEQARRQAELARQKAENEARQLADAELRRRADEARRSADADTARRIEEEAKRAAAEEARRRAEADARAEAERKAADEARRKIEAELAEARRQADEARRVADELRQRADTERKAAEEAKLKAEQEAKKKADEDARKRAEADAKAKLDAEAKQKAEADAKKKTAEDEAKKKAEEEAKKKQQIAAAPAPAMTQQAYLAQHDVALKQAIVRQITGRPDDYVESSIRIEGARVGALTNVVVQGDTLRASGLVEMRTSRYSQSSNSTMYVNIVVRGFPSSAQLVSVERAAGRPGPQVAAAPATGQADGAAYLARHDAAIRAMIADALKRDSVRFQPSSRPPISVSVDSLQLQLGTAMSLVANATATMKFELVDQPLNLRVTVRGYPNAPTGVDLDRVTGQQQQAAAPPPAAPSANQTEALAYLARHDGAIKAAVGSFMMRDPGRFQTGNRRPNDISVGAIRFLRINGDNVIASSATTMNFGGFNPPVTVQITIRGYPGAMTVVDVDRSSGSPPQQASNPAGAPDAAQYLAKHWPAIKSQIESDAIANPRNYQTRGLSNPGSALATLLRMESQSGDAMVILVRVRMVTRDGQNSDGADVRVTVKGFPDSARFVEAN